MASSGYKDKTVTSDGYIKLRFSWVTGTPNVANNFTPVNWTLSLISTNSSANINSSAAKDYSVTVDGSTKSGTNTVGLSGGASKTLASGSKNIYHETDGTKTFNFNYSQEIAITYSGVYIGTITDSGTGTLDPIPRSSVLGTISNFTIGNTITVPITKYSSNFADTINIYVGSTWIKRIEQFTLGQAVGTVVNKSVSFTQSEITAIYNAMPNVTSASFRFVNTTYSGANILGTSTKTATGTITSTIKPTISSVTLAEAVSGLNAQFGFYVQNKSKIAGTITVSNLNGSSIDSYNISINGTTYTSSTFTTEVLTTSGNNSYSVVVTDKRGRTASTSGTFNVTAYTSPTTSTLSVVRCTSNGTLDDNGNYAKVNATASITSLSSKNTKSFVLQYKLKTASTWTTNYTYTGGYTLTITNRIIANISADNPYEFRIVATDYFGAIPSKTYALSSGYTIMDIKADGKGVAFGKVSSKNALEIGMPIYDEFDTRIGNGVSVYEAGGSIDVNNTLEDLVLSSTNTPSTAFWYVRTMFYSTKSTTSNRTQIAYPYNLQNGTYYRYYITGTGWSSWRSGDLKESSINNGSGYVWFSNGFLMQWGRVAITPTSANTVTTATVYFPKTYDYQPKVEASPNVAYPNLVTSSIGGGTTEESSKQAMIIYMTRTNTAATTFQWLAIGFKGV